MAARIDPDDLAKESGRRNLRYLSDRLISEIATLRRLEGQARELRIGSPEFEYVSQELSDHARSVFGMSAEQVDRGAHLGIQDRTINDVPPEDVA